MLKNSNITASIGIKLVRKFSFLIALMLGMVVLSSPSFAACTVDPPVSCEDSISITDPTTGDTTQTVTVYASDGSWTKTVRVFDSSGSQVGGDLVTTGGGANSTTASTSLLGVAKVICEVVFVLIFDIGRGIATLSIISVGIAAMFGKATWTQAVTVAAGIGIMYGGMMIALILTLNFTNITSANYVCYAVLIENVSEFITQFMSKISTEDFNDMFK